MDPPQTGLVHPDATNGELGRRLSRFQEHIPSQSADSQIAEAPSPTTGEQPSWEEKNSTMAAIASVDGSHRQLQDDEATGSIGTYHIYKRRWFGVLCITLVNICTSWGWLSFAAIADYSAEWFGFESTGPINWLSTVILFSYIAITPLVFWILSRNNIRVAMWICAALAIIGNWLRYAGTEKQLFGLCMFGQILIGFAQPFALSAPLHYTDLWFTSSSRVSANAIASLANPLGGAIAQLVGPGMVTKASDMPMFILVTAAVTTACSLIAIFIPAKPPLPPCPSATITKVSLVESARLLAKNYNFWGAFVLFGIYVGMFNAFSTFLYQIMGPYGYTSDDAGIAGALLIFVGIGYSAVTSPLTDRFHHYKILIAVQCPIMAGCYIAAIYMSTSSLQLVGPYVVCAILGAASFSLLPIFLEWCQEQTSPADPSLTSSLLWCGGQLFGAIFIIVMNALKYPDTVGNPPGNMHRALIFEAVFACVGLFGMIVIFTAKENARVTLDQRR